MSSWQAAGRAIGGRQPEDMRIRIVHFPGCPLVDRLRSDVEVVLAGLGLSAAIEEAEGSLPSPTLLINGIDVTGQPPGMSPACRLQLPTTQQIVAAIHVAHPGTGLMSGGFRMSATTGRPPGTTP